MLVRRSVLLVIVICSLLAFAFGQTGPVLESRIKIDPSMLLMLKECRSVMAAVGDRIWKGWDMAKTPILFYRPGVQDILIGYPHQPAGFQVLTGFNPLAGETVYYRDGKTFIDYDGQNTATDIDGVKTLVVADGFSNARNQIRAVFLGRDKDFGQKWLDAWNFLPEDPYGQMSMILHEGFHIFQGAEAPDKGPNEMAAADYPLLDVFNNSCWSLEAAIIQDALGSETREAKIEKIKELVAVRHERRAALKKEFVDYEDLTEYLEGLAKYIEFKFLITAQDLQPSPELFFLSGFYGYGRNMKEALAGRFRLMKEFIAASKDATGNKFGVGPLRFRLYSSGAALALFLDEVDPAWKTDIFQEGVYLFNKLEKAVPLSDEERFQLVAQAKSEYGFESLRKEKAEFEAEGRKVLNDKVQGILGTKDTLVVVDYSEPGGIAGMAFTPFGLVKVSENETIYDPPPVGGKFKGQGEFKFEQGSAPVLLDKAKKEMSFAVKTAAAKIVEQKGVGITIDGFRLTGCRFQTTAVGNKVRIRLLK